MRFFILIFLLSFLFSSCKKVQNPQFRKLENFGIRHFGVFESTIGFDVTFFNPNNFGVAVKEAGAEIYLDSVYIGRFVQDTTVQVGKNSDFSIPLSGKIPLSTALKINFKDITKREILLRADGTVKIGKAGIYVVKPFHYAGKHKLSDVKPGLFGQ